MASPPPPPPLPTPPPEPGLRERKKAQTRQRISDLATRMFLDRGYESVRVADIAAAAGVSEKTVFNYFPTKESLVFDYADEQRERIIVALRTRGAGVSPTRAFVDDLESQLTHMTGDDFSATQDIIPRFGDMFESTPALRAAWGDHRHAMVHAVAAVIAADLGVDPREPEPMTTARALVSLFELSYDAVRRNVADSRSSDDLWARVSADIERGARLLDTGLWSVGVMIASHTTKEQLREAADRVDQARSQVLSAMRDARRRWRGSTAPPTSPSH